MPPESSRSIQAFLDVVKVRLSAISGVASCEIHRGRFALDDITHSSFRVPALRLALMGLADVAPGSDGTRDATLRLSLALVTRDAKEQRDVMAHGILNELALLLPQATWGLGQWVYPADGVKGTNLFSGDIDRMRILLWEMIWTQTLRLGNSQYPDDPMSTDGAVR